MLQWIMTIHDDLKDMIKKQTEVFESLNFYGGKIDEFGVRMDNFQKTINSVQEMDRDVRHLKLERDYLRGEIESMHQQQRMANIEISGLPEKEMKISNRSWR
ncbi:hypothetical protein JTB14_027251 [Gonioctena quinquepunctata]|nr:hypothetical protein JTB14_027251 [Gonioctena quinquepunctata]